MSRFIFGLLIFFFVSSAEELDAIDKWLDLVDLRTTVHTPVFSNSGFASTSLWTETGESKDILVLKMKVFKGEVNTNGHVRVTFKDNSLIPAKKEDVSLTSIIEFSKSWWFQVPATLGVHVNGILWMPPFKILVIKMNGIEMCSFNIGDNLVLSDRK